LNIIELFLDTNHSININSHSIKLVRSRHLIATLENLFFSKKKEDIREIFLKGHNHQIIIDYPCIYWHQWLSVCLLRLPFRGLSRYLLLRSLLGLWLRFLFWLWFFLWFLQRFLSCSCLVMLIWLYIHLNGLRNHLLFRLSLAIADYISFQWILHLLFNKVLINRLIWFKMIVKGPVNTKLIANSTIQSTPKLFFKWHQYLSILT
jgi:hypothetical protein